MVRNYVRKKPPLKYSKETLKAAIEAVQNQEMTVYRASITYKIPKATLFKHVKGQRGVKSSTMGRPTAIPYEEEKKIAESIKLMEKWGFGLSKKEVLNLIGHYVKENNIKTSFKDGIPGNDYFMRFKKTFNLSQKKPQMVEVARKRSVDPFIINDYFTLLRDVIKDIHPSRIYNIDETSFCLDPSRIKVVGQKGTAAHRATSGSGRENISVLLGGNAVGEKLPPHIVFKGKNVWDSWLAKKDEEYAGLTYSATKNGWMEAETFQNYFKNSFLKSIPKERPVILIYDGHSSHVGILLIQMARRENIVILKLPPHSSHVLQPMDLSVFRPLKIKWEEELVKWQRKNYGNKLPKSIFASIISKIWENIDPVFIKNGFQKAGIAPYCNTVIPIDSYEPQAYKRWCSFQENQGDREFTDVLPHQTLAAVKPIEVTPTVVAATAADLTAVDPTAVTATAVTPAITTSIREIIPEPSTSRENISKREVLTPLILRKKSFEELLLEQIKQTPKATSTRKKICGGAEVITSEDAIAKLEDIQNEKIRKIKTKTKKKLSDDNISDVDDKLKLEKIKTIKKGNKKSTNKKHLFLEEDSSSDNSDEDLESLSSNPSVDEVEEMNEEISFLNQMHLDLSKINVGDWIVVKYNQKKLVKMFVGQITEKEPCLEVKFCRRYGKTSTFYWPVVEDRSIIERKDIFMHLPTPSTNKRGKISFSVVFDSYNVG